MRERGGEISNIQRVSYQKGFAVLILILKRAHKTSYFYYSILKLIKCNNSV